MILLTGANGQLGQCFRKLASRFPQYPFLFTSSADLDITDRRAVDRFFQQHRPSWCINCAAY
ncbi:MAG TPA: sugar nucleotide-binding protein, partial [Saprospiraceae bacterium]|nr:sugar nucleotide-binding protein [Saprospiraceae bacterium]